MWESEMLKESGPDRCGFIAKSIIAPIVSLVSAQPKYRVSLTDSPTA